MTDKQYLISLLNSKSVNVRKKAIENMAFRFGKECIPMIMGAALSDENISVRAEAAHAIMKIGEKKSVDDLLSIINAPDV